VAPRPRAQRPVQSRLERRIGRAVATGHAFRLLAVITLVLGIGTGLLAHLVDKKDFHTYGDGVWWAIVTLATVGYGDIVPTTPWGRVLGVVVIVTGVTFISFLTATVTSLFMARELDQRGLEDDDRGQEVQLVLARIERRLDAIEASLAREGGRDRG